MNYEKIKNDINIINLYQDIKQAEDKEKGYAYHDYNHVINVSQLIEKILKALNYDENYIDDAMVAALLHDTGCLKGKQNHAHRSYIYAKKYIEENNIKLSNKELVLEAIKDHSNSFDTDNIMTLALILSDKLDVKYTRVGNIGKTLIGMRQFLNIEDVLVDIKKDTLIVNFKANKKLNLEEIEEYYFTNKIFKGIVAFSQKMNLNYNVMLNNELWNYNIR